MHTFKQEKLLPNSVNQIADLILDVKEYPEFVPWCESTKIISNDAHEIIAEMTVNYKGLTENYKSRITTKYSNENIIVDVKAIDGPFKYLNNIWTISEAQEGSKVHFNIELEFKSFLLDKVMGLFFISAAEKMIEAFEDRARKKFDIV